MHGPINIRKHQSSLAALYLSMCHHIRKGSNIHSNIPLSNVSNFKYCLLNNSGKGFKLWPPRHELGCNTQSRQMVYIASHWHYSKAMFVAPVVSAIQVTVAENNMFMRRGTNCFPMAVSYPCLHCVWFEYMWWLMTDGNATCFTVEKRGIAATTPTRKAAQPAALLCRDTGIPGDRSRTSFAHCFLLL